MHAAQCATLALFVLLPLGLAGLYCLIRECLVVWADRQIAKEFTQG